MDRATLDALQAAKAAGRALVLATRLPDGAQRLIDPDATAPDAPLAAEAAAAARADRSAVVETGGERWFLGVHNPPLRLIVVGAVHITQALAPMAAQCGFAVTVVDSRPAFITPERFPGVTLHEGFADAVLAAQPAGRRTALVALSHNPTQDDPLLAGALRSPAFYVGALGSRKSHAARCERLRARGFSDADLARIKGPVGLPIGAVQPAEIAVAILAQMIAVLRQGDAGQGDAGREGAR